MVVLATVMAALWVMDVALPGLEAVRATGAVVLACGFVASAAAVVPGFERLIHGNRWYLVVASLLGLVALASGVALLVTEERWWLAALIAATIVLWGMATVRHTRSAARRRHPAPPQFGDRPHQPAAL